jgi:hypothetical protein
MASQPQQVEFRISPKIATGIRLFCYPQLFITPPYPTQSFASPTIIVTGSRTGLSPKAARHYYRLHCSLLILAIRIVAKDRLRKKISSARSEPEVIEVWPLDSFSTASNIAFQSAWRRSYRVLMS